MPKHSIRDIRTVMVASGLSPESVAAIDMGRWLAGKTGAELHVVHVAQGPSESARRAIPGLAERVEEQGRQDFEAFARQHLKGANATVETRVGHTATEILDARHDCGADVLVFGRYGKGGYKADRLGSVANQLTRRSPVSVLIVPPDMRGGIASMAAAIDPYEDCEETLLRAGALAQSFGVPEVPIIAAFDVPSGFEYYMSWEQAVEKIREVSTEHVNEQISRSAPGGGVKLVPDVVEGHPQTRVAERARELGVNLLILGSHQRTGLAFALLGHTAETIIARSHCAVWAERSPKLFQGAVEAFKKLLE